MGLMAMINNQRKVEKKIDTKVVTEMSLPSGLLPLDYANGLRVTAYDQNDRPISRTDLIGLVNGSNTSIVGISGTGKTALGIDISVAPIHAFGNKSYVHHADIEQATTMQRILKATKLPPSLLKETYEIYRDRGAEDILDQFKTHCQIKLDNIKQFTYNTGVRDMYGEYIHEIYPSSLLIDSFALFKSKEIDLLQKGVDDITNNMRGAQDAKFNKAVLNQIIYLGKKANVNTIMINHINQDVNTGFMPKPSMHMYLSQGESLPGGQAALFLCNNLLKLKLLKKFNADKAESMEYGVPGFMVEARYVKSRTNATNIGTDLIFDHTQGRFSKTLTLLHFAVKNNILLGSPRSLYIPGLESVKFTKKTFRDQAMRSPEVMQALYEACLPNLEAMLSTDLGNLGKVESDKERFDSIMNLYEENVRDMEVYRQHGWVNF